MADESLMDFTATQKSAGHTSGYHSIAEDNNDSRFK